MIVRDVGLHYLLMIPVQLEYTAPAECPTRAEFVALVAGRGGEFATPDPTTKPRRMIVTLRRAADEHTGSLELRHGDLVSDARQLHASRCAEVAEALAVVAAIALRTSAEETAPIAPLPEAAPVAPAASSLPPITSPTSASSSKSPSESRLRPVGVWGEERVPVTAGQLQVKRSLALDLAGGVVLGAVPGLVLPRYDLSLTRTNFITTPAGNSFLIGNVFGVRWTYLGSATHRSGPFSTQLNGFKAGVNACASLSYDSDGFVALVCSSFTVGLMHLETKATDSSYVQSKDIGLGAASLELDARYAFGKYLHLGLTAGGEVWLSKLSAERPDNSELFHSRLFNAHALLALGLHF